MNFSFRSVDREREFEKRQILRLKDDYLSTDVVQKVLSDDGYRDKVQFIESQLGNEPGWILDIGSNTCGEAEYFSTRGYNIICSEINEHALDISQTRSARFGRPRLHYVACDGHRLPFQRESISYVMFNESLHHMLRPSVSLAEVHRVLRPGGRVFLYEPYAYDPYRRISEVRDYFRGTIEKSFSVTQLHRMLSQARLRAEHCERHVVVPSRRKLERLPPYRRFLRNAYANVAKRLPSIFGMVAMVARKEGSTLPNQLPPFLELLQCPITGTSVKLSGESYRNTHASETYAYRALNGIPILMPSEAVRV